MAVESRVANNTNNKYNVDTSYNAGKTLLSCLQDQYPFLTTCNEYRHLYNSRKTSTVGQTSPKVCQIDWSRVIGISAAFIKSSFLQSLPALRHLVHGRHSKAFRFIVRVHFCRSMNRILLCFKMSRLTKVNIKLKA